MSQKSALPGRAGPGVSVLVTAIAAISVSLSIGGCTDGAPHAHAAPRPGGTSGKRDEDGDWDHNSDENAIRYYGRPAAVDDRKEIVSAVRRYYEAIAVGDAVQACSLIDPGFGRELLAAYGRQSNLASFRTACALLLSRQFLVHRPRSEGKLKLPRVLGVRVAHHSGYVLLAFRGSPVREIPIANGTGSWKMASLFDVELP